MSALHRTERLNAVVQQEVNAYLLRFFEPPQGCLLTVEEVRTSSDLSHAKIFVSVLPPERGPQVLADLKALQHEIRTAMSKRLPLRTVPELHFVHDTREERADRISRLLSDDS